MFNRSAEEFNKSHINNALNVPYMFITEEGNTVMVNFLLINIILSITSNFIYKDGQKPAPLDPT